MRAPAGRPSMGISSASVALEGALWLAVGVGLAIGAALLLLWLGRASEGLVLGVGAVVLVRPLTPEVLYKVVVGSGRSVVNGVNQRNVQAELDAPPVRRG